MPKFIKNILRILLEDEIDMVELFGAMNSMGWGLWFIFHPQLFDNATGVYAVIGSFGNELAWGLLLLGLGLSRLIGVSLDRYKIRKMVAMAATVVWSFMAVTFFRQNSQAIIVFITAENAVLAGWEYIRHARKVRIRQEIREEIGSHNKAI